MMGLGRLMTRRSAAALLAALMLLPAAADAKRKRRRGTRPPSASELEGSDTPDPNALGAPSSTSGRPPTPPTQPEQPAEVDSGGDVVESIDGSGAAPSTPPPSEPAPAAASAHRIEAGGWTRSLLEYGLIAVDVPRAPPDPTAVPHDRLVFRQQLFVRLRYAYKRLFELDASGLLSYGVFVGDSPPGEDWNGGNAYRTRTAFEGQLRDLYLAAYLPRLDLRVGQQRIVWGRGDAFTINDVWGAYDLRNPLLAETEELHIPIPALRADIDFGLGYIEAVATPFFVGNRYDLYGANWATVQPRAPEPYRALLGLSSALGNDALYDAAQPLLGVTDPPAADFSAMQAGLRFALNVHKLDFDAYYQYGYDRNPRLRVDPMFLQALTTLDYVRSGLPGIVNPYLSLLQTGTKPIVSDYVRRHHVGLDVGTTVGPVVLRAEASYDSAAVFPRASDLQSVVTDTVQAVLGFEYQPGELGKLLIVEGWYMGLISAPADPLLLTHTNNGGVAALFRWRLFRDHLELEARALVSIEPLYWIIRPQLGYLWRGLAVRIGMVYLDGEDGSFGAYYKRNSSIYSSIKYSF
jgi:hypothetical protein